MKPADETTGKETEAARALLGWSQRDLSKKFEVSLPTIAGLEQDGQRRDAQKAFCGVQKSWAYVFEWRHFAHREALAHIVEVVALPKRSPRYR